MGVEVELQLACGVRIAMKSLAQSLTYDGLLEGVPTRELNARLRRDWLSVPPGAPPVATHLVDPLEVAIAMPEYPFGEPATMPAVVCRARFQAQEPVRRKDADYSQLMLIWCQGSWALPIDSQVIESIVTLDWRALAEDFFW